MEKIIFVVIALFFIAQLIWRKDVKKLPWFFAGILFFPPLIIITETPKMFFSRLMIYAFLINTVFREKSWYAQYKKFPFRIPLLIMFLCLLAVGLADDRLNYFLKLYRPITYFLENFFVLFLTYYYIKSTKDALYVYDCLVAFFFIFCIYGLLNFVTKQNEYNRFLSELYGGSDIADDYNKMKFSDRFRISSFVWSPIVYGFLVAEIILIMSLILNEFKVGTKKMVRYIIVLFLLLLNLFLANSRTPIFALVAGGGVYMLFAVNFKKKIVVVGVLISLIFLVLFIVPNVASKIIDKSIAIITGSNKIKEDGSSVQMRTEQLDASEKVFNNSPVFGNGFQYITEGLGFSSDIKKRASDKSLHGFESYFFELLIEQGLFGIIGNIIFFLSLIIWLLGAVINKNLRSRKIAIFNIGLIISFLIFILGTGALGTFPFFMALLGINLKLLNVSASDKSFVIYKVPEPDISLQPNL